MFASLHQEQDKMVFCNQLLLGQLIFVEKLEVAHSVLVLKGIRPIPGRFPCVRNLEDLFAKEKSRDVEKKPQCRYRSLILSKSNSICTATCYGSGDNSSRKTRNSDDHLAKKLIETSSRIFVPVKNYEHSSDSAMMFNLANDNNRSERKILRKSLSPLGKEVLRHKDVAMLIAVEALKRLLLLRH
ncbi:hypothetical protein PS1_035140 [Malus domestica]|uniref:DUF936 domain-containing protein n=1 Tax=Malus domestica TaxID=3750 RepID=A0A498JUJ4_MALDO|nr:hypothetical protein DVH24_007830 [Malus domestica]